MYHRVLAQPDPLFPDEVDAQRFAQQCRLLRRWFRVLPLSSALQGLRERTLPARAACITFDDGYADNVQVALPILQALRLPATFFIASGFLNGGQMWNDRIIALVRRAPGPRLDLSTYGFGDYDIGTPAGRREAIGKLIGTLKYRPAPERTRCVARLTAHLEHGSEMMSCDQVRTLHRANMEIGAHTVSHPILSRVPAATAQAEIADGKRQLEDIIDAPVTLFAYPNGKHQSDFDQRHVGIVRELGFIGAVTTERGAAHADSDPFQLPRFTPWDKSGLRFLLRLQCNLLRTPR